MLVGVLLAACSVDTDTTSPVVSNTDLTTTTVRSPRGTALASTTTTSRADAPAPAPANFARPGPYEVGLTTLSLGDRSVRVFYPAAEDRLDGLEHITSYRPGDAYPPEVAAILAATVPPLVADLPLDAYLDAPVNDEGPFPIVLQSHGAGGSNLYSSQHLRQEASWGFVVASPDHLSRNEVASITDQWGGSPTDLDDLTNTLAALVVANADPESVLAGGLDTQRVGTEGHSAGGAATYLFSIGEPRVKAWIGQASVPATPVGELPPFAGSSMVVFGEADGLVSAATSQSLFDALAMPKRAVAVSGAGHSSFLDRCAAIFAAGGLTPFVEAHPALTSLLTGAGDGCAPGNVEPDAATDLINHVMIAQYRLAFGQDRTDVSLDPAYLARTFPTAFGSEQVSPPQEVVAPTADPRPGSSLPGASTTTSATP